MDHRDATAARRFSQVMCEWNNPLVRQLGPGGRDIVATALADAIRDGYPPTHVSAIASTVATRLRQEGVSIVDNGLTPEQTAECRAFFASFDCLNTHVDGHDADAPVGRYSHEDVRRFHHGCYSCDEILRAPHLLELFTRPDVLDVVEAFLGARGMLFSVNAFWSFPHDGTTDGQQFHRDKSHPRFCVLFVYLSDVDRESGAHQYIRGSNSLTSLDRFCEEQHLNVTARQFFDLPNDGRGYDELYDRSLGPLIVTLEGMAGTTFIEDAYGVHRGLPPRAKPRLMAWARYSLFTEPPEIPKSNRRILGDRYPAAERARYALRGIVMD
jgi:hypothetical protein